VGEQNMAKKRPEPPPIEPKEFQSVEEIDRGIAKLKRRIGDVQTLNPETIPFDDARIDTVEVSIRETIREIFGPRSPEFDDQQYHKIWHGGINLMDSDYVRQAKFAAGIPQTITMLEGLIKRLEEKREDLVDGVTSAPSNYFDQLNLHPRIRDVARDQFLDGYHWEAVFAAAKALVNYVKERSGRHDLDGAPLMRTVFSKNEPVLAFNDLSDQTDLDEQEGMMHLFEGTVLGIRNPGGHSFPEGPEQRAIEYISFLSLLAYRVQEAKRLKSS
jgi:uncharacterized protein (TIGR02391 family)